MRRSQKRWITEVTVASLQAGAGEAASGGEEVCVGSGGEGGGEPPVEAKLEDSPMQV